MARRASQLADLAHAAVRCRREKLLARLCDRGLDLEAVDHEGHTLLMQASDMGWTSGVQLLVHRGAHLDVQDHRGFTALMWAAVGLHQDVIRSLVLAGADRHRTDASGMTAYDHATRHARRRTIFDLQLGMKYWFAVVSLPRWLIKHPTLDLLQPRQPQLV